MMSSTSPQAVELSVKGMTCGNCASKVGHYLHQAGADDVDVDLQQHTARFIINDPDKLPTVLTLLGEKGFPSSLAKEAGFNISLSQRVFIVALCTAPMLLHMVIDIPYLHLGWVQCLFSIPVIIIGILHFGRSAFGALKRGIPNMDVLITLGAGSAFVYSVYGLIHTLGPDYYFFETAASIITFVLFGNLLEEKATHRTTSAIRELKSLQQVQARKVLPKIGGESIVLVDAQEIEVDDILLVTEGDRVSSDGTLLKGSIEVDESILTGESLPVPKSADDMVYSGTIVSSGNAYFRVTTTGNNTVLGEIIRLVKQAQEETPDIQRLGDIVSAYFVPAVTIVALATYVASWYILGLSSQESLLRAIAVLVIACPCAMGLATPTAVVMGVGLAARKGILIKGGATLEHLANVKQVFFDKTGTLTDGKFRVEAFDLTEGIDRDAVISVIRGLEQHSNHPLAESLLRELPDLPPHSFTLVEEIRGQGIQGTDAEGNRYLIGAARIRDKEPDDYDLIVLCNDQILARLRLQDEPRDAAKEMIQTLQDANISITLVSGDKQKKCEMLASELGITSVFSEQSPAEKLNIIASASQASVTAFVGDGINDAPALAKATVGIALQGASHTALQSARVVVLSDQLRAIPEAFIVADVTLKTIKQNLFWAFFYNILAIPVAAAGYLNPMIAAFTMAFSDVIVVGNSLYLKRRLRTHSGVSKRTNDNV